MAVWNELPRLQQHTRAWLPSVVGFKHRLMRVNDFRCGPLRGGVWDELPVLIQTRETKQGICQKLISLWAWDVAVRSVWLIDDDQVLISGWWSWLNCKSSSYWFYTQIADSLGDCVEHHCGDSCQLTSTKSWWMITIYFTMRRSFKNDLLIKCIVALKNNCNLWTIIKQ